MIRAIRPAAMAQDDASMVSGWNVSPNGPYVLAVSPGASAVGVLLYSADMAALIASGAAIVGSAQPCVLVPQAGQEVGMIDAGLGWHLLLTTTGDESARTIRIGPAADLPDEIHPVYGTDALALAKGKALIDESAHYRDDVVVTCPHGLGAWLGGVVSVPVDGSAVVGQVESITWVGTPLEQPVSATVRRHVAIEPEPYSAVTGPALSDDEAQTTHDQGVSGNVLANDEAGLTVTAVAGLGVNVGQGVAGSAGGVFVVGDDGEWTFDPDGDFDALPWGDFAETVVSYHASDGEAEGMASLAVTVRRAGVEFVAKSSQTANAGQTYSVDLPAGIEPGDLIVVIVGLTNGAGNGQACAIATSGYTTIVNNIQQSSGYRAHLTAGWKFAAEGDTSVSVTVGATSYYKSATSVYVFRGVDETTPIDVTPVTATSGVGTSPSVTPVTAGAVVLMAAHLSCNALQSGIVAPESLRFTQTPAAFGSNNSGAAHCCGAQGWDGSGAVGPETWAGFVNALNWAAASIAIRPAS